jgi:hypothetical protein
MNLRVLLLLLGIDTILGVNISDNNKKRPEGRFLLFK